jgi:cytosine/adenosine deaminase-related metal-dependent hydrolase
LLIKKMNNSFDTEKVWNFKKLFLDEIKKNGGWVNSHAHADRAYTMNPNKLDIYKDHSLIEKWDLIDEVKKNATVDDYYKRIAMATEVMIEQGVTAFGTFVDSDSVCEDRAIKAALKAKKEYKDQIQIVLAHQPIKGLFGDNKQEKYWFEAAVDSVDILGGLPKRDKVYSNKWGEHIDLLFEIAKKKNKMVHVHVDQFNDPSEIETEELCDKTIEHRMQGKVVAIHGISIAAHTKEYRDRLYKKMVNAEVMMIACPVAWIDSKRSEELLPFHNALTPIDEMIPAGVTVALGTDNICDFMVPFCDGDMWQELMLMATGNRYMEIDELVKVATVNGRKVLGIN